eukprot:g2063.t1
MTSSRICIKNLPKYADEILLREFLTSSKTAVSTLQTQLTITDLKVLHTKSGVSRRLAFVGFASPEEATEAIRCFNRAFFDTSKLSVEQAFPVGDQRISRPWSKHSEGSSAHQEFLQKSSKTLDKRNAKDDKLTRSEEQNDNENNEKNKKKMKDRKIFDEFLSVTAKRGTASTWSNDAVHDSVPTAGENQEVKGNSINKDIEEKKTNKGNEGAGRSDLDFLQSKIVAEPGQGTINSGDEREDKEALREEEEEGAEGESTKDDHPKTFYNKDVASHGSLFVRNLSYKAKESDLTKLFSTHGSLAEVNIFRDDQGQSKGYAIVTFVVPENAVKALAVLDGQIFMGRLLHVLPAKQKQTLEGDDRDHNDGARPNRSTFQIEKDRELAKSADDATIWSALFLRSDTALKYIASQLDVRAGSIMDTEKLGGGELAVRQALLETNVIEETKEWLSERGVCLEALKKIQQIDDENNKSKKGGKQNHPARVSRSKMDLFIKNLPWEANSEDLFQMFSKTPGVRVKDVLIPPAKSLAIIRFMDEGAAKLAFKAMAYRRYKSVPLYLEWAPQGLFAATIKSDLSSSNGGSGGRADVTNGTKKTAAVLAEGSSKTTTTQQFSPVDTTGTLVTKTSTEEDQEGYDDGTVSANLPQAFIKGLSFHTTEKNLLEHILASCNPRIVSESVVKSITIPKNKRSTKGSKKMNDQNIMGYAFVQFRDEAGLIECLKKCNGTRLKGHTLVVSRSQQSDSSSSSWKRTKKENNKQVDQKTLSKTKLLVKNVAFEATKRELMQLFGNFGKLKALRLPRKFDGGHRGFAFIEYMTAKETSRAKEALASTHFYGRHLIVNRAKKDEAEIAEEEKNENANNPKRRKVNSVVDDIFPQKKRKKQKS